MNFSEMDRSFDIVWWQDSDAEVRFDAIGEMVAEYWSRSGSDPHQFRLDRTVESFEPTLG